MGILQEQDIPTLFQGISTQSPAVRFTNQVEDAQNVSFRIETGGFSKRMGTTVLVKTDLSTSKPLKMHTVEQGPNRSYLFVHDGETIRVYNRNTGQEVPFVVQNALDDAYLETHPDNIEFLSVLDYTFVVNKTVTTRMVPAQTTQRDTLATVQLTQANLEGTYGVTVRRTSDGVELGRAFVPGINETNPPDIMEGWSNKGPGGNSTSIGIAALLRTSLPAAFVVSTDGSYLFLANTDGEQFSVETLDPLGNNAFRVNDISIPNTSDLLARGWDGHQIEVRSPSDQIGYVLEFKTYSDVFFGPGEWKEAVPYNTEFRIDPETMPKAIVPEPGFGQFNFERLDWSNKKAGGPELVPNPDFIGSPVNDVVFTRNRLGLVSGENVYFSKAGDFFNFWPDSGVNLVATDPFGLSNSTDSYAPFLYGVNFRKSLFILSPEAQLEAYGEAFSADGAKLDLATRYPVSGRVRPVTVGDELYFVSETGRNSTVYTYTYSEDAVSEVANEVTRHVRGLLPSGTVRMVADPLNNEIILLSERQRDSLYVHTFYYDGNNRVQSAWTQYRFKDSVIKDVGYQDGDVVLLIQREDNVIYLESLPGAEYQTDQFSTIPRLDRQTFLQGTYVAAENKTHWTLPYYISDVQFVTPETFPEGKKFVGLDVDQVGLSISKSGRWDYAPVLVGQRFESYCTLSKQFVRNADDTALVNGRLQLRRMSLRYAETGYFEVDVEQPYRDTRTYRHNGRFVNDSDNTIQSHMIDDGTFVFLVGSNAATTDVTVRSNFFLPFTITSGAWLGFYNEVSRQDNG